MYRTVDQLYAVLDQLTDEAPQLCTVLPMPETSVLGGRVVGLRISTGERPRPGVLFVGGTHARELMNPDLLVELAVDVAGAVLVNEDVALGDRTWTASEITAMLDDVDLYLLPCSNPDGRTHVLTVDDMWRKNRRDNPGTACDGVDLNRNADLLWGVTEGQTSCAVCTDIYCGTAAFSEPENRNVVHLLDQFPIVCFADVHSYSELVLYPWGHAPNQTTDPTESFPTLPTGTCRPIGIPGYREYIDPADLARYEAVSGVVADEIEAVRGSRYTPQTGISLYPTTGTLSDYAYSRHLATDGVRPVDGYTLETGPWMGSAPESFHPADPEPIKREAESGLLALIRATAESQT